MGHKASHEELGFLYEYFYGGIAWPSKEHPGFAVVIGVVEEGRRNRQPREVHVLQECEDWDIRELLQACKVFYRDLRCEPRWVSNQPNAAAEHILRELNKDGGYGSNFWPGPTTLFADDPNPCPYAYLLPKIKSMLDRDDKRLFLKGSKVSHYLSSIPPDQLAVLEPGAYPAIEALGYAIMHAHPRVEVRTWNDDIDDPDDDLDDGPAVMGQY
ncbi:MAG: hypothetical protein ACYTAS_22865 [Planctomycetota bacterium]